ncbi:MAG TPA: hypothetical protein DEA96_15345 [Leptospiraceae bacterium]|nr:hypothetical protein [Spirochaetaceae bacterium]HBS06342.1 hypothetical protein [Leptospiraceae bacterium]
MKSIIDYVKRLGAGIIVIFLVLMMGVTFSSQPMDEILAIFAGQTKFGSFDGEDISEENYGFAYNACKQRFAQFGEVPDIFLNGCLESTLQELYVLPKIARRLGLDASEEEIERDLVELARQAYQSQEVLVEADRQTVQDFYRDIVQQASVKLRSREASARRVSTAILAMESSPALIEAATRSRATTVSFRMVRYTQTSLLAGFDDQVQISDEELKSEYESWKKEKPDLEPLDKVKGQVLDRVRTGKKQAMLAKSKEQLSKLKPEDGLNSVSDITGITPRTFQNLPLEALSQVRVDDGKPANLATGDFFRDLTSYERGKNRYYGPYQDGEATVYVEIVNLNSGAVTEAEKEKVLNETGARARQEVYRYMIRTEAQRGDFNFRELASENERQIPVQ